MIHEDYLPVAFRMRITEEQAKQIPFFAKILAAVPGQSLNKRNYDEDVLRGAARPYLGRPMILDHDYEDTWKVMGTISNAFYGWDKSKYTGKDYEGLWLNATGLMPVELYEKIAGWCPEDGGVCIPPMVRGVSIGGEGEGDPYGGGVNIKRFVPQELSITAFPGIPDAHIASFERITESISTLPRIGESEMPEVAIKDPTVRSSWQNAPGQLSRTPAVDLLRSLKNGKLTEGPPISSPDQVSRKPPAASVPMQTVGAPSRASQVNPDLPPSPSKGRIKNRAFLTINADSEALAGMTPKQRAAAQLKILQTARSHIDAEEKRIRAMKYVNPVRAKKENGEQGEEGEEGEEEQGEEESHKGEMGPKRAGSDTDVLDADDQKPPDGLPGKAAIEPRGKHKPADDWPRRAGEMKDDDDDDDDNKAEEGTRDMPPQGRGVDPGGKGLPKIQAQGEEEQGEEIVVQVSRSREGTAVKPGRGLIRPGVDWTGGDGNNPSKSAAKTVGTITSDEEGGEEAEERISYNGKIYRLEQEQGEQGEEEQGEQGEEEQGEESNPILRAAGMETARDLARYAGGPEGMISPEIRDTVAWQARANSLPNATREHYAAMSGVLQQVVDPSGARYYGYAQEGYQPIQGPASKKKKAVRPEERRYHESVTVSGIPQIPMGPGGGARVSPAEKAIDDLRKLNETRPDLSSAEKARLAWLQSFPATLNQQRYKLPRAGA